MNAKQVKVEIKDGKLLIELPRQGGRMTFLEATLTVEKIIKDAQDSAPDQQFKVLKSRAIDWLWELEKLREDNRSLNHYVDSLEAAI